jgi:hypothetical protein
MGVVNPEILYLAGSAGARVTARKGQALRDFSSGMASFGEALSRKREKFSALKAEFPEGIDRKFINEDVREQLTSYVTSEKDAYNKNIKTMKRFPAFTKKYKDAVEENNKIKAGMTKVNEDLMYVYNAGIEAEKIKLADGTLPELEDDHMDLATGDIWDRGFQLTREGVNIGDYAITRETQGEQMYKPITDVKVGKASSTAGSDQYNALSAEVLKFGINGGTMDDGMKKYYKNKLNGMLDGLSETELRHFYFNGMNDDNTNESSGAYSKLLSMGYEKMEVPDEDVDPAGYQAAIANNLEYNRQLDKLKYSTNLSTPELKNQLMNTLFDVHTTGKNQFDEKERKNDLKAKQRQQVTQKDFFAKVPEELKDQYDGGEVAIGINDIKTRKSQFDNKKSFQGQFYYYGYDPVAKRYIQFKNLEAFQANSDVNGVLKPSAIRSAEYKVGGGNYIIDDQLLDREKLNETGIVNLTNLG